MSINVSDNRQHLNTVLKRFAIGAVLCLPLGSASSAGLPAVIDVVTDTAQLSDGPYVTIDNQTVVSVPLGDIDGDGLGDRYIEIPPIEDDFCPGIAIVPSSLVAGLDFSRNELDALIRIVDTPASSTATLANGNNACRYRNVRGFSEPRRMGDINGDGLTDLVINVSGIFDNTPRIVFGSVTAGTRIDLDRLDGNTGFSVVGGGYVVFPVGDINNDGIDDIGHWQGNAGAQGVIAGRPDYSAQLDVSAVTMDERLIQPLPISGLRSVGDLDGDGFADLLAYPRDLEPYAESNIPRLIYGSAELSLQSLDQAGARVSRLLEECGVRFCSIYPVGDLDADGRDDLIASQRFEQNNNPPRIIIYGREGGIESRNSLNDYPVGESTRLVDEVNGPIQDRGRIYVGSFNEPYLIASGQRIDFDGDGADDLLLKQRFTPRRQAWYSLYGTPGRRPATRSFAEADGLLGVVFDVGTAISPITSTAPPPMGDINSDGLSDFLWTSRAGTPFVAGRPRDLNQIDPEGLLVRRGPESAYLRWQAVSGANEYRVRLNDMYVADVAGDQTTLEVADVIDGATALYSVEAYDSDGSVLLAQQRRMPVYTSPVNELRVDVYGERLLELFFTSELAESGQPLNNGAYLVLRDGVPVGRASGRSFVDDTVEPGRRYSYQVMTDVLYGGPVNAAALDTGVRVQRVSQTVEVRTPGTPTGAGEEVEEGGNRPEQPMNLRVDRYSLKDAEVFWDRATQPLLQYEVLRDGQLLATQFGISYFDTRLTPGSGATYEIIALQPDGSRSATSSITLPAVNTPSDAPPSPTDLRSLVYSRTAAELFWTRAAADARVVRTEVSRDGTLIGSSPGNSFFDDTREPGRDHSYSLVAIDADGERSAIAAINTSGF